MINASRFHETLSFFLFSATNLLIASGVVIIVICGVYFQLDVSNFGFAIVLFSSLIDLSAFML